MARGRGVGPGGTFDMAARRSELRRTVERCLIGDPDARRRSAHDLNLELRRIADVPAEPPRRPKGLAALRVAGIAALATIPLAVFEFLWAAVGDPHCPSYFPPRAVNVFTFYRKRSRSYEPPPRRGL